MRGALTKLSWQLVVIIGLVFCLVLAGGLYQFLIKKQLESIAQARQTLQQTEEAAGKLEGAKQALADATVARRAVQRRLAVYRRTKMIPLSMSSELDQYHTMVRLWHEQAEVLGPLMERHIGSTGVVVPGATAMFANLATGEQFQMTTGSRIISVPAPPTVPSNISAPNGWYRLPLGSVTISTTKGFPEVMSFLRSFTRAPRLVSVGAPSIRGISPNLTVTVPLQAYYLVEGVAAAAPRPAGGMGMGMGMGMDPAGMPMDPGMAGVAPGDPGMGGGAAPADPGIAPP